MAQQPPPEIVAPREELTVVLPGSGGGLKETVARVVRDAEVRLIRWALAQAGNNRTEVVPARALRLT